MISFLLFLLFVAIDAIKDKDMIHEEVDVHTVKQYVFRAMFIAAFALFTPDRHIAVSLLSYLAIYWWSFDAFMGYLLKKDVFYLGDGKLDKFQKNGLGVLPWFFFKLLFAFGGAVYIIKPSWYQNVIYF